MPVLPYVPNAAQLAIRHVQSSQAALCTLHLLGPSGFNSGDLDELCETAAESWGAQLMPGMSFKAQLLGATARGIRGEGDALGTYTMPTPTAGSITNESERPQEAVCIKLSTGLSGAGFRGRMYLPGIPNNVVDEGLLDLTYRQGRASALSGWLTYIKGNTAFEPVIISYYREKVLRAIPVVTPIQKGESVTTYPSKLSSRTPGSGS